MNPHDSFEDELRRQTLRSIPPDWKKSILPPSPQNQAESIWSQLWISLFYPHRYAYACLLLLWVGIAFFSANTPVTFSPQGHRTSISADSESGIQKSWQEKQRYLMVARSNPAALEYIVR